MKLVKTPQKEEILCDESVLASCRVNKPHTSFVYECWWARGGRQVKQTRDLRLQQTQRFHLKEHGMEGQHSQNQKYDKGMVKLKEIYAQNYNSSVLFFIFLYFLFTYLLNYML